MTPPLASETSVEKIPDRESVRSDRRAENPGIRKEEDKLRLDSWVEIRSTGWDKIKCSSPVLLVGDPSIPLKNPEGVREGKKKQEVKRNSQEHEAVVRVQREKIQSGWKKDKRFEGEDGVRVVH